MHMRRWRANRLLSGPAGLPTRLASLPLCQLGLPFMWWVLDSVLSCLLQFSRVESLVLSIYLFVVYDSGLEVICWINPPAFTYSPKLMEFISSNPYTYVCDRIKYICRICWWFIIDINNHQHMSCQLWNLTILRNPCWYISVLVLCSWGAFFFYVSSVVTNARSAHTDGASVEELTCSKNQR
jgi:hypothetical protein